MISTVPKVVDVDERRAALIAATSDAIARDGLANVTLRSIARSAGWTTGIVTHYFTDKRELLMATFDHHADLARARIVEATATGAPLLDAAIDAALPLDADRLRNWRVSVAYLGAAIGDDEMVRLHRARTDTFLATIREGLAASDAAGRLAPGLDLDDEAQRLVGTIQGLAVQAVLDPERCTPQLQRRHIAAHLRSLTRPARTRKAPT